MCIVILGGRRPVFEKVFARRVPGPRWPPQGRTSNPTGARVAICSRVGRIGLQVAIRSSVVGPSLEKRGYAAAPRRHAVVIVGPPRDSAVLDLHDRNAS